MKIGNIPPVNGPVVEQTTKVLRPSKLHRFDPLADHGLRIRVATKSGMKATGLIHLVSPKKLWLVDVVVCPSGDSSYGTDRLVLERKDISLIENNVTGRKIAF